MSSTSPHGQFSPSTSTHSGGPQVKTEHGGGGDEAKGKPKTFVCDKCGKRYARRDYLERHALNHEARSYKCEACGKGFARIDVLKKHETVACKMLRSPGDAPSAPSRPSQAGSSRPVVGAGAAGASGASASCHYERPRVKESQSRSRANSPSYPGPVAGSSAKRQKIQEEQRRYPSSSSSSSASSSNGDVEHETPVDMDMRVPFERRFSGMDQQHPSSQYHHMDHHHHQQQQQRYSLPHINATPLHPPTHLPPIQTAPVPPHTYNHPMLSPTQPKDMSISLAPAYAPTPDVTDLTNDSAPLKTDPDPINTSRTALDAGQQPTSAHPDSGQTIEWEDTTTGAPGVGSSNGGDFAMGGKVGENMDDLLGWLFNTNPPNSGGDWAFGIQQGQIQQDMQGHQFLPTFAIDPMNNAPADMAGGGGVDSFANGGFQQDLSAPATHGFGGNTQQSMQQQQQQSQQQQQQWLPPAMQQQGYQHDVNGNLVDTSASSATASGQQQTGSGNLTVHRRYPQAFHPLYVPNIPGKTSIPNFSGSEKILVQGREKYKEVIDEDVRNSMLEMFEGPGKRELMSPAFSLQRMRLYLELYFMHFAPLYPIIHQPSLRFRRLPPDLLLALICIGTAFAEDKEGLRIASKLHKRLRNRIFESVEDEPKASVHSLQTLLLINHFSRSYCSLKEHDISQIFHSPSVYMIRLAGTLLPKFTRQNAVSDDPVTCWLDWVGEEERKRLGWFAFMMDLENAALYRHFLMIHCYFMEIPFPTSSPSWTAPDPFTWSTALRESLSIPTPSFRNALRELAGRGTVPPNLNDQSLWILIHGLINVSWTLLWRDLGELSMVHENKITGWKDSLRRAFKTWVGHVEGRAAVCEEALYTVGIPFAQLGSVLLLSDTEEIRIFAGASNIAGRSISPGEWTAANTYVHAWARSQDGAYACYTAVELLSQVYKWSAEDRWATAPAFIPWCTYVSSLIIWAYTTVLDGPDSLQAPYIIPMTNNADKPLEHGQTSEIRIEPSLARRAAQTYIANMLQQTQGEAFALPDVQGKNACAGVLAYTAYLMGIGGRGVLDEARRVLLGLLGEG